MGIVGAGHAGGRCALLLRQKGFDGGITLIGEESSPPYERPPLSKGLLTGDSTFEKCLLVSRETYIDRDINLLLGESVVNIERAKNCVLTKSGNSARGFDLRYKQWIRLVSWQNAEQQADIVAGHINGSGPINTNTISRSLDFFRMRRSW